MRQSPASARHRSDQAYEGLQSEPTKPRWLVFVQLHVSQDMPSSVSTAQECTGNALMQRRSTTSFSRYLCSGECNALELMQCTEVAAFFKPIRLSRSTDQGMQICS